MKTQSLSKPAAAGRQSASSTKDAKRAVVQPASAALSAIPRGAEGTAQRSVHANIHPDVVERDAQRQRRRLERMQVMQVERTSRWWENAHSPNVRVISRTSHFKAYIRAITRPVAQPAVMSFFRPDCPGCKRMYPKMMQIVTQYPAVDFFKVHAGKLQEECEQMDVNRMPHFRLYLRGELVAEFSANLSSIDNVRRALEALKRGEDEATAAGAAPAQSALSAAELLSVDDIILDSFDAADVESALGVAPGGSTIEDMVQSGVDAMADGFGTHPLGVPTHRN